MGITMLPLQVLLLASTCAAGNIGGDEGGTPTLVEVKADATEMAGVVVYSDRAQVTRRLRFRADAAGTYDVHLSGLTPKLEHASVRVKGRGPFVIAEVSSDQRMSEHVVEEGRAAELRTSLEEVGQSISSTELLLRRVEDSRKLVAAYVDHRLATVGLGEKKGSTVGLDNFQEILKYTQDENAGFDETELAQKKKLADLRQRRDRLRALLQEAEGAGRGRREWHSVVRVVVEMEEASEAILDVSYTVRGARWTPRYDLRVQPEDGTLGVKYYGEVSQQTGEDWKHAPLKLSTASPVTSGSPPNLPRATVSLESDQPQMLFTAHTESLRSMSMAVPRKMASRSRMMKKRAFGRLSGASEDMDAGEVEMEDDAEAGGAPPEPVLREATERTAKVAGTGGVGPVTFEIPRHATIPSQQNMRNVTTVVIGVGELPLRLTHYAVPAMDASVFMEAATNNTTPYPMLPGSASVFVDGDFVTSVRMNQVFPGESFRAFVGQDPMVKMTVNPLQRTQKKYRTALLWGGDLHEFSRTVTVRNTKGTPVNLRLVQQLPRSTDEEVKVSLLTPHSIPEQNGTEAPKAYGDSTFHSVDTSTVVWLRNVAPGREIRLPYTFSVKWSGSRRVEYHDML
eukprot:Hpha_TRINITY_DN9545_c0_g1::TRINITY_DN9545_c0_g1_i1::g.115026::m.115026